ncbi:ATP-binding protein [Stigmatella aurantiaca]|nr:ATP-binding protein [Stigmatella aurantiaca]EAU61618.1 PAS [Stigmatella aurantiaca DW4/3-1]
MAVNEAYQAADEDRLLIERSLELMSQELTARNDQLRIELADKQRVEQALRAEKEEQAALIQKLEDTHSQLLQSEKMASIGQIAAGLAHEINNPIGFVSSNIDTLRGYVTGLVKLIAAFEAEEAALGGTARQRLASLKDEVELAYVRGDAMPLLNESLEGLRRVRQIIRDLTDFSHVDDAQWQCSDLHKGLDSTLNIVHNEVRHVADVIKQYGELPEVECLPSQVNQVFLNMLVNAAQSIKGKRGLLTLRTGLETGASVFVEISDNGEGIAPEHLKRIFDPFFTTKPVGKGTGLGLSLSYSIIAKHHGRIEVRSERGSGTTFRIILPVKQTPPAAAPS